MACIHIACLGAAFWLTGPKGCYAVAAPASHAEGPQRRPFTFKFCSHPLHIWGSFLALCSTFSTRFQCHRPSPPTRVPLPPSKFEFELELQPPRPPRAAAACASRARACCGRELRCAGAGSEMGGGRVEHVSMADLIICSGFQNWSH